MFGFFKNRELDKRIARLEKELELLNISLSEYAGDQADISTRFLDDLNNMNEVHGVALVVHDERLKRIELLLNEPSASNKENVEPITTTDAILKVLNSSGKELNFEEIFNNINKYNLNVKQVSMASVKSTAYGLASKGRLGYGKKQGTFKSVPGIYG